MSVLNSPVQNSRVPDSPKNYSKVQETVAYKLVSQIVQKTVPLIVVIIVPENYLKNFSWIQNIFFQIIRLTMGSTAEKLEQPR